MPNKQPIQLSVVIVNYNVYHFLVLCLKSVERACADLNVEIIVVDNASTDKSCEQLEENFPNIVLIANKDNVGFSKANNQGVVKAKGEYVLILNPDTVVGEHTFSDLLDFVIDKPKFGAVGVQLIDGSGAYLPESKRGIPTLKASFYKLLGKDSDKGTYYSNHLEQDGTGEISILVGAFMFLKRLVYLEVGGFDEDYFMYGEDIDLSYKLLKSGYKNYYLGSVKAVHFKGESTRKDVKYLKHFHGAMEIFYKKHFNSNLIKDSVMKLGIKLCFLYKYIQLSDTPIIICDRENILYVGDKKVNIDKQMHRKLNFMKFKTFKQLERYTIKNNIEEIWFDESTLSYGTIIDIISTFKTNKSIYKFHSENTNYVIGSNTSDGRGEIIDLV